MPNTLPFGFVELHKLSGKEHYDLKAFQQSATRVFRGPWANRSAFIDALLPGISEANGEITFSDPGVYPALPALIASKVDVDGGGKSYCTGPDSMIDYEDAILTVTYEYIIGSTGVPGSIPQPFPNFTVVQGDVSSEIFTFQKEDVQNAADPFDVVKELRKLVPIIPITIKILFHPAPKFATAAAIAGKVNSGNFFIPKMNIDARSNSLLFYGMSFIEKGFINGLTIFELDFKFGLKGATTAFPHWNELYNRKGEIKSARLLIGDAPYEVADFNVLFNQQIPNP